ncbi:toll-like receptor 6 [Sitodiplosis mosellana]|uniref:toll-like receptor 6 n=1 Tax=Sitodiplosis mosellana TaxID=263140 RepID=UPI00244479EE|nr:toll-like receptor 6 [Sitodiplosis mosellana]
MKFRIFFAILLWFFIKLEGSPSKTIDYNDCRFIDNTTASVELFCGRANFKHSNNDCYSIFLNSSSMAIDRPKVDLLKFDKCGPDSRIINISSSFLKRFPKLRVINLSNLSINTLQLNCMDSNNGLETINDLIISRNDLVEVPKSTFNLMPNLTTVNFSHNKIKMIFSKHFAGAIQLTMINLSNNIVSILSGEAFSQAYNLEFLDLSVNKIQTIDNNMFVNNGKLKHLNLNLNPVKRFNFDNFSPLANSLEVQISWNQIESLNINCRHLNHHFKSINEEYTFKNVRIFNVSGCRGEKFLEFLDNLNGNVEIFDFSYNFIDKLMAGVFERFTNLKALHLSHMNLSNIGLDTFSYQTRLKLLDLSYNGLTNVGPTIFSRKFFHLEHLNLEGNQLITIDSVTSINFPNMIWLSISKNQFSCKYLTRFLDKWKSVEKLQLAGDPSRYQMNIEGIDCYFTQIGSKPDDNLNEFGKSDKNLNQFRQITNNEECTNEKLLLIWTYGIIGALFFIALFNFIAILFMCRKSRRRRLNGENHFTDQITAGREIEKRTNKGKAKEKEIENIYEEINLQCSNSNQSQYDVPRFTTMQKSYL